MHHDDKQQAPQGWGGQTVDPVNVVLAVPVNAAVMITAPVLAPKC